MDLRVGGASSIMTLSGKAVLTTTGSSSQDSSDLNKKWGGAG